MKALIVPRDLTGESLRHGSTAAVTASAASVYFPVYALVAYPLVLYYLCFTLTRGNKTAVALYLGAVDRISLGAMLLAAPRLAFSIYLLGSVV